MNEFLLGKLEAYCYMVKRGKPAAMLPVQCSYITEAKEFIDKQNLNVVLKRINDNWIELWIYKYPHIEEVIEALQQEPKTKVDHWILGKLFGYDEKAIHDFLIT